MADNTQSYILFLIAQITRRVEVILYGMLMTEHYFLDSVRKMLYPHDNLRLIIKEIVLQSI